jgi:transcriptional regulator with XRE-family HTH domain
VNQTLRKPSDEQGEPVIAFKVMNYAKAFRVVRAAFGLSQTELSRLLHVGPSQVSLIEAGKRQPSHKVIDELAETLRIPVSLVTLLASEPKDLENNKDQPVEALALSLLRLLVSASDERLQQILPFVTPEDGQD